MQNTTPSQNPIIKSKMCPKLHSKETSQMLCILYWYALFKWWSKIWKLASVYENSQTRQLCFSCLGRHRVSDCQSRSNCKTRHHTNVCNIRDTENAQSTSTCSSTLKIKSEKQKHQMYSSSHRDQPNVLLLHACNCRSSF